MYQKSPIFKDIQSAIELSTPPHPHHYSTLMTTLFIEKVNHHLEQSLTHEIIKFAYIKIRITCLIMLVCITYGMYGLGWNVATVGLEQLFSSPEKIIHKRVKIQLSEEKVFFHDTLDITLIPNEHAKPYILRLYVKNNLIQKWQMQQEKMQGIAQIFSFPPIESQMQYRIYWNNIRTPIYTLNPVDAPNILSTEIRILPPKYTGLDEIKSDFIYNIKALSDSKIYMLSKFTKPIRSVSLVSPYANMKKIHAQLNNKEEYETQFVLKKEMSLQYEIVDIHGKTRRMNNIYYFSPIQDKSPIIHMRYPLDNLIVQRDSIIPIKFYAQDDIGLQQVFIEIKSKLNKEPQIINIKRYPANITSDQISTHLNITPFIEKTDQIIQMRIGVIDCHPTQQKTFSRLTIVEIKNDIADRKIELDHMTTLEHRLSQFSQNFEGLIEHQKKQEQNISVNDNAFFHDVIQQHKALNQDMNEIVEDFQKQVDMMSKNPVNPPALLNRYNAIIHHLQMAQKKFYEPILKNLKTKKLKNAIAMQKKYLASVEQARNISQSIQKYETMVEKSYDAQQIENTLHSLEQWLNSDLESQSDKQYVLDEIENLLHLSKEQNKNPINMESFFPPQFIENLQANGFQPIDLTQDLEQLQSEIQQNNIEAAKKTLAQIKQKFQDTKSIIQKSAQQTMKDNYEKTNIELQKTYNNINNIIQKQKNVSMKTRHLELIKQKKIFQHQQMEVEKIQSMQKNLLKDIKKIIMTQVDTNDTEILQYTKDIQVYYIELVIYFQNILNKLKQVEFNGVLKLMQSSVVTLEECSYMIAISILNINETKSTKKHHTAEHKLFNIDRSNNILLRKQEKIMSLWQNLYQNVSTMLDADYMRQVSSLEKNQADINDMLPGLEKNISDINTENQLLQIEYQKYFQFIMKEGDLAKAYIQTNELNKAFIHQKKMIQLLEQMVQEEGSSYENMESKEQQSFLNFNHNDVRNRPSKNVDTVEMEKIKDILQTTPIHEFQQMLQQAIQEKYPENESEKIRRYYKKLIE